jgi:hypothetical protein
LLPAERREKTAGTADFGIGRGEELAWRLARPWPYQNAALSRLISPVSGVRFGGVVGWHTSGVENEDERGVKAENESWKRTTVRHRNITPGTPHLAAGGAMLV